MASEILKFDQNSVRVLAGVTDDSNEEIKMLRVDPITKRLKVSGTGSGSGTVTSVSVVSANGLAGTVATATTTPAITLSTTVTGILSGNGTAISAASTTGTGSVVLSGSPALTTPSIAAITVSGGILTLPTGATSNLVSLVSTDTLTNKRVTKRTGTTTSSATPTINTNNVDFYSITAQAVDITSFTTNLSGTPTEGQTLWIAITGTAARAITWGASFEASTVALPTTTVTTARLDVGFVWNTVTSKWRIIAQA